MGSLGHVPARCWHTHGGAQVRGPGANPPERANNERRWAMCASGHQIRLQIRQQVVGAGIAAYGSGQCAVLLRRPAFQCHGRTCISCPVSKGRHASPGRVHQVFEIIKRAAARAEAAQQCLARRLALVGVAEHDVTVGQGRAALGQFLEAKDDRAVGGLGPCARWRNVRSGCAVAVSGDATAGAVFDRDGNPGCNQLGHAFGRYADAGFVVALFGAHPQMGHFSNPLARITSML